MSDVNAAGPATNEAAPTAKKSIVPAKYAGKYKEGGSDALAAFINSECREKEGFSYSKFFELCRANGLPGDKVDHYEKQVIEEKRLGSQGRARMTLRNMLATIARKEGKLKGLDGSEVSIEMPAIARAAKAQPETASEQRAEGKF